MTSLREGMLGSAMMLMLAFGTLVAPGGDQVALQPASPSVEHVELQELPAESSATLDFPAGIAIESTLTWPNATDDMELELLYRTTENGVVTLAGAFFPEAGSDDAWTIATTLDLQAHYLPVGVDVTWWWRLSDERGIVAESAPKVTGWFDDRWEWRSMESDRVTLHEYALDPEFAEHVLETIQATVIELETRFGIEDVSPLSVWIYDSNDDFQIAKPPNSRESIAALSYPEFNLVAAILSTGDDFELLRVLPHEVSHHVLAQATDNPFTVTPLWFDEGMATHVQTGGVDGYAGMVGSALDEGQLFNLNSLIAAFPYQPFQATLAYATSWSAMAYLFETYGDEGIARMIDAFAQGIPYDSAIRESLGIGSEQLIDDWTSWVANQESNANSSRARSSTHVLDTKARHGLHRIALQSEGFDGCRWPVAA